MTAFTWLMRILVLALILGWAVSAIKGRSERAAAPPFAHVETTAR